MIKWLQENTGIARWACVLVVFIAISLLLLGGFRVLFVNLIDNYEIGYTYDLRTGKIEVLEKRGYVVTPPFLVKVHTVDLRPMQVCINANARVLNCKLLVFNPAGLELFLSWHGRDNYAGPGTSGTSGGTTPFSEILKSYAFEGRGKSYPFLTITTQLKPEEPMP